MWRPRLFWKASRRSARPGRKPPTREGVKAPALPRRARGFSQPSMNRHPTLSAMIAATFCTFAVPALAHPHIFIDATVTPQFDAGGRLAALRVDWAYDEFYSLALIAEYDLDGNNDGTPDPDRLRAFAGKDVDWAAGFPGDLVVEQNGRPARLGPVRDHAASWKNGRIVASHTRPLPGLDATQPVKIRVYDPEYFVAYDVPSTPVPQGRTDCTVTRERPAPGQHGDLLAALSELDMQADSLTVMSMADVGITFADTFVLTCAAH